MAGEIVSEVFKTHDFLRELPKSYLMTLMTGAKPFRASPGDFIAREGEGGAKLLLIQRGRVELKTATSANKMVVVQTVSEGEVVGWSWNVAPFRWQFSCVAATDVEGLAFDGAWLREICEQNHELGYHLHRQLLVVLANRLTATRKQRYKTGYIA